MSSFGNDGPLAFSLKSSSNSVVAIVEWKLVLYLRASVGRKLSQSTKDAKNF
jgi:hypothetical protein